MERLLAVNYFRTKAPWQMFDWVLNTPLKVPHCLKHYDRFLGTDTTFTHNLHCVSYVNWEILRSDEITLNYSSSIVLNVIKFETNIKKAPKTNLVFCLIGQNLF